MSIVLSDAEGRELKLDDIVAVARERRPVALDDRTARRLDERRAAIVRAVNEAPKTPLYGFNTGFGSNVRERVAPDGLVALQKNLIRSHACGVGDPAPQDVVRATMLLRARSLARGHSSVRAVVVKTLVDFLNKGVTPVVPRLGTVSASGDLAPLSHVALALMGEGEVFYGADDATSQRMPAAEALKRAGVKPLSLEMKEGLALNNGCQYSAAWAALTAHLMRELIDAAAIATAMTGQVMFAADTPFREDLHALRPHEGARRIARRVFALFQNSPIREFHRDVADDGELQDPYNLRCAAQILGACETLVARAIETIEIEANSVTDNPIDVSAPGATPSLETVVSGGHFHGMPLAVDLFGLIQAAAIAARLSNMRCVRYVDKARNRGLGAQLRWPGEGSQAPNEVSDKTRETLATESGMLIPEYVSAGLSNWIWGLAMPSHLMSLSTDSGQEDHVSMAANVGMRAHDAALRLSEALAIEFAYAAQASAIRKKRLQMKTGPIKRDADAPAPAADADDPALTRTYDVSWWRTMTPQDAKLSPACERVASAIAEHFPTVVADRVLSDDLQSLALAVRSGALRRAADGASQ